METEASWTRLVIDGLAWSRVDRARGVIGPLNEGRGSKRWIGFSREGESSITIDEGVKGQL